MKYARLNINTAVDVRTESPEGFYTPNVVAEFIEVPDQVEDGWILENGEWSAPPAPPAPEPTPHLYQSLSAMQFYLAFKPSERIAIKNSSDENVKEFWDTYTLAVQTNSSINPNLTSVQTGLTYLATPAPSGAGILASMDRVEEISNGVAQ